MLAELGDAHYPEFPEHWIRLVNLDASALDALGPSEIELAAALAGEEGLMGFALGAAELDPVFRVDVSSASIRATTAAASPSSS